MTLSLWQNPYRSLVQAYKNQNLHSWDYNLLPNAKQTLLCTHNFMWLHLLACSVCFFLKKLRTFHSVRTLSICLRVSQSRGCLIAFTAFEKQVMVIKSIDRRCRENPTCTFGSKAIQNCILGHSWSLLSCFHYTVVQKIQVHIYPAYTLYLVLTVHV